MAALITALLGAAATVHAQDHGLKALVGGTLIDGFGSHPITNSVILIEGERIAAIGQVGSLEIPAGAEVISTEGMTVLPGLWDMHVHLMITGHSDYAHWDETYPEQFESVIMPASARQLLLAGITSARDLGAPLEASINVRDRINRGEIPGPTMYMSGPFIQHQPYPGTELFRWGVQGAADGRAKVRRLAEAGVDVIKLIDQDQMTMEEVQAVVDEAHQHELPVVAHSHRPEEIRRGIAAGVDCFEHTGLSSAPAYPDDVIEMIRERTAQMNLGPLYWTPTISPLFNYDYVRDNRELLDDPSWKLGLPREIILDIQQSIRHPDRLPYFQLTPDRKPTLAKKFDQLRKAGLKLLIGTDSGVPLLFHSQSDLERDRPLGARAGRRADRSHPFGHVLASQAHGCRPRLWHCVRGQVRGYHRGSRRRSAICQFAATGGYRDQARETLQVTNSTRRLISGALTLYLAGVAASARAQTEDSSVTKTAEATVETPAGQEDEAATSARQQAEKLLAEATRAYQRVIALRDRVDVVIRRGDAEFVQKFDYSLGGAINASLKGPQYEAVSKNGKLFVTKNTIARKYLEVDLAESPGKAKLGLINRLAELLGHENAPPLLPVDMRAALGFGRYLRILRAGKLGPLAVESVSEVVSERGSMVHQITFAADNGHAIVRVRPETYFLTNLEIVTAPTGDDPGTHMKATFNPEILDSFVGVVSFDSKGRKPVETLADLRPTRLELGEPVPELLVPTLDGRNLALGALRGASVVFVFWSTSCVNCGEELARAQEFVEWASGQPIAVRVLAVNTLEDFARAEALREVIAQQVEGSGFSQLVLADWNHEFFVTIGLTDLPRVVVADAEGKIRAYLNGLGGDLLDELKEVVLAIDPRVDLTPRPPEAEPGSPASRPRQPGSRELRTARTPSRSPRWHRPSHPPGARPRTPGSRPD